MSLADPISDAGFSTEALAPGDRAAALRARLDRLVQPGLLHSRAPKARVRIVGAARGWQVVQFASSPVAVVHEPEHVETSPPGYLLWLQVQGRGAFRQGGCEIRTRPGDLVLRAANRPSEANIGRDTVGLLARVSPPDGSVGLSHAIRLARDNGASVLLRHFLTGLQTAGEGGAAGDLACAGDMAYDMLCTGLGATVGRSTDPLRAAILDRIEEQLADCELSIDVVARDLGVSTRTIQRCLRASEMTFSSYVTMRRLDMCRRDLSSGPTCTVTAVCFRWGFSDLSHFSTKFRARFGVSPGRYRRRLSL